MQSICYDDFVEFWVPIIKKQIFNERITNNRSSFYLEIQANIWSNWNLTRDEKKEILKELGIWRIR